VPEGLMIVFIIVLDSHEPFKVGLCHYVVINYWVEFRWRLPWEGKKFGFDYPGTTANISTESFQIDTVIKIKDIYW